MNLEAAHNHGSPTSDVAVPLDASNEKRELEH